MRSRAILISSLVANLVLALGWYWTSQHQARHLSRAGILPEAQLSPIIKTNVQVRRQFFSWQEVEADDYPDYIANLRAIACPEQTIRDIIIADVNALYARKFSTEIITAEQQWWRSVPDTNVVRAALARRNELDQERRAMLTRLLGTDWEGGDLVSLPRPTRPGVALDGPVLGDLPNETKQAVEGIVSRSQERVEQFLAAQRSAEKGGQPNNLTAAGLAKLDQQTRAELAAVLAPAQLEEFLLRYSPSAVALRGELGQLQHFPTTPEEFRALFRATDALDQQLAALAGATDPSSITLRQALEGQRSAAIRNTLGRERYAQFQMLHDAGFRAAYAAALAAGNSESAPAIYEINQAAQEEYARLRAQTNLSPEQLAIELKKAELEQLKGAAQALGQDLPPEPPPLPPKPAPKKTHVLAAGQTLDFIARLYGVDASALRAANPNVDFGRLKQGDSVSIPISLMPVVPVQTSP